MTTQNSDLACFSYDFPGFAAKINENLSEMFKSRNLFRVDISNDDIWKLYIESFPEGTNPIFRERTYHEGNYDKSFIRRLGTVVSIVDGKLKSIWDMTDAPYPYNIVAAKLSEYIHNTDVSTLFRISENFAGAGRNKDNYSDIVWNHFNINIDRPHYSNNPGEEIGSFNSAMAVYIRALDTFTISAVETVLDLINDNAIYRGEEFKDVVKSFYKDLLKYSRLNSDSAKNIYAWGNQPNKIRNSSIGSLIEDISNGEDLEVAVKKFESKVAPENYKRSSAPISKKMVEEAVATIRELGLEESLPRRHAVLSDVSVNNVIWVDRAKASVMKDSLLGTLMEAVKPKKIDTSKATDIGAEEFFENIVPNVTGMEIFFGGNKKHNLVNVTAPVNEDAPSLFKWDNAFGWSYNGDIADSSITQKVKTAGGNINAPLRVSLAWFNYDDLDLHANCPDGHVYYCDKKGILDIDMNAGGGHSREAVENLSWKNPKDGKYTISVKQFSKRESVDTGFTLEVVNNGAVSHYNYNRPVTGVVSCFEFVVKNGLIIKFEVIDKNISGGNISENVWNLATEDFVKVDTLIKSPNHWDENGSGNLHWFFIMENCKNPDPVRGMYNEFLKGELDKHRKVFEVLGSKSKCENSDAQLAGLGFSSTRKDKITVRVKNDDSSRVYNVQF